MVEFNYEAQMERAKAAVPGLKQALEDKILGKTRGPWKCNCGAIHYGESVAVEVVPAGREPRYEGQIPLPYLWTVKMKEVGSTEPYSYSCGISGFLPRAEIDALFNEAFSGIDIRKLETECYRRNPR